MAVVLHFVMLPPFKYPMLTAKADELQMVVIL